MNSIERTLCAIRHQPSDRVPVALHNFMVTARMMGTDDLRRLLPRWGGHG